MEKVRICVGIQKRMDKAKATPTQSIDPYPKARPAKIGIPPDIPPHKILQGVFLFSQREYMMTSKNRPAKTIVPKSKSIVKDQPTPVKVRVKPRIKASLEEIFPAGRGRQQVLSIFASMSRSIYMLSTVDPLIARNKLPAIPNTLQTLNIGQRQLIYPASPVNKSKPVWRDFISGQYF
jgi:hypothetical protein